MYRIARARIASSFTVPCSSLHRFVVKHSGFGARGGITVRMADVAQGELTEIDFRRLGLVHHPATNRRRVAWALLVVLRRVVLDNLRAAITKADRYDPIFQRTMEEYARHRGFLIDPAPVRMPMGTPHVERGVPYISVRFLSRRDVARSRAHAGERDRRQLDGPSPPQLAGAGFIHCRRL
jgi:hypothetical protein